MTARKPLVDLAELGRLPDEELERARVVAMAALSERQRVLVEAKLAGKSTSQSAEAAGYRSGRKAGLKALKGRGVAEAIAIGREVANRRAALTIEDVRFRFQAIYRAAIADGDLTNANRALEQLARLGGLYPEQAIRLTVDRSQVDLQAVTAEEWELASRLVHQVRRALPPAAAVLDAEVTPVPKEEPDAAA